MNVAFAGTPAFAAAALAKILAAGFEVPLVLTQPDRPAGRGMKLQASAVKQLAHRHGLAVAQPRSLRLDGKFPDDATAAHAALHDARPDVLVVAAYGLILPAAVLTLPHGGCLNIHASLLPRWRGAAPIQRAIEAGDTHTGITIMQMDEGLDTGAMLLAEAVPITGDDSAATLHDRLAELGARLIVKALELRPPATPQPADGVSYAHKIEKAEGAIDWTESAAAIERRVRAFDPFPGVTFDVGGERLKLWRARVMPWLAGAPGEVVLLDKAQVVVRCGEGALDLQTVQRPGGVRIGAEAWLRDAALAPGQRLG
jgi:methionyl-tRNA formyltransferase